MQNKICDFILYLIVNEYIILSFEIFIQNILLHTYQLGYTCKLEVQSNPGIYDLKR